MDSRPASSKSTSGNLPTALKRRRSPTFRHSASCQILIGQSARRICWLRDVPRPVQALSADIWGVSSLRTIAVNCLNEPLRGAVSLGTIVERRAGESPGILSVNRRCPEARTKRSHTIANAIALCILSTGSLWFIDTMMEHGPAKRHIQRHYSTPRQNDVHVDTAPLSDPVLEWCYFCAGTRNSAHSLKYSRRVAYESYAVIVCAHSPVPR